MTATVQTLAACTTAEEVIAALADDGCVIVSELVAAAVMDDIADELAPFLAATPPGSDEFSGRSTRRTGALISRSPTFRGLAAHPLLTGTLDRVLGDHATAFQLHLTQVIDIGPGEAAQLIHRDQWAFDFFKFPSGFEVECHTMWALTDFTEANGATRVIPGSHRWEDRLQPDPGLTVGASMAKGSVFIYVGSVYHGGGANASDARRLGINVGYSVGWLRQEENQYLACSPDVARTLPEDLLRLMGYQRGAYALGYVDDLRDPLDWLHDRTTPAATFSP
jgi:ectoine hydroxylase-related dioxygenase (phytanoyl-CoA dioxygenase family)